jgi:hypothetical protein
VTEIWSAINISFPKKRVVYPGDGPKQHTISGVSCF